MGENNFGLTALPHICIYSIHFRFRRWPAIVVVYPLSFRPPPAKECTDDNQCDTAAEEICCPVNSQCELPVDAAAKACGKKLVHLSRAHVPHPAGQSSGAGQSYIPEVLQFTVAVQAASPIQTVKFCTRLLGAIATTSACRFSSFFSNSDFPSCKVFTEYEENKNITPGNHSFQMGMYNTRLKLQGLPHKNGVDFRTIVQKHEYTALNTGRSDLGLFARIHLEIYMPWRTSHRFAQMRRFFPLRFCVNNA